MGHFAMSVETYMSAPVFTITPDAKLEDAQYRLIAHKISSLAVVDSDERLVGVISRTDLLRIGRRDAGAARKAALLTLPTKTVQEVMTTDPRTVSKTAALSAAATEMVTHRIHRLFVVEGDKLVGVISTRDIMLAIRDVRLKRSISDFMSSPVFTVRGEEPLSLATDRLAKAHVSGLVVVENDWPLGIFTQVEALEAKHLPRETPMEEIASYAMLNLEQETDMHRAAAQAAALGVRRVICVKDRKVTGILTGIDFARAAAN